MSNIIIEGSLDLHLVSAINMSNNNVILFSNINSYHH